MKNLCKYVLMAFIALFSSNSFATTADDAGKYIETLGNSAVATLSNAKFSKEQKTAKIEKLFRENVDVPWVGKFVLGRFWKQASAEQQKRYLKEYETFITERYATRFSDYTGGSFKVLGTHDDGDDEFTVNMQIQSGKEGSAPVLVDYRVRKGGKNVFNIFDIVVEGVSMITTQRSEFASVISANNLDYLIAQLSKKQLSPEVKAD
jgi:phospholipid transport system substrate-binding protein